MLSLKEFMTKTMQSIEKELEVKINETVSRKERKDLMKRAKNLGFSILFDKDNSKFIVLDKKEVDDDRLVNKSNIEDLTGQV